MASAALALAIVLLSTSCSSEAEPAAKPTPRKLVVQRRAMTAADRLGLDPPDGAPDPQGCSGRGQTTWDYGPIGPGDPRGRTADDALRDAIRDLRQQAHPGQPPVPSTGWVELRDGPGSSTFVQPSPRWRDAIVVSGDPDEGIWRHQEALTCDRG